MSRLALTWAWSMALIISILGTGVANAVTPPECQRFAPQQSVLSQVRTARLPVPSQPFGLSYAVQEDIAFVSLDAGLFQLHNSSLGVLNTSTFPPTLVQQVSLPNTSVGSTEALGLTVSRDGRYVFVAGGIGAFIVDAAKAISGDPSAVVGSLKGITGNRNTGYAAIEVTLSHDQKHAFISQEYGPVPGNTTGNIDVFKLDRSMTDEIVNAEHIGHLNLGYAVVGTALSPDGRFLYAVSEATTANDTTVGALSMVDVEILKTDPSNAQRFNVSADCGPVRIIVSSCGRIVWVTARESNRLLAFDAAKLAANISDARIAAVQVGQSPVGLTFVRNETLILTADSNRFGFKNATTGISVVDVQAVLNGSSHAAIGQIPTRLFPREFAVSPDGGTVLVAEFDSSEVQAIAVSTLPSVSDGWSFWWEEK